MAPAGTPPNPTPNFCLFLWSFMSTDLPRGPGGALWEPTLQRLGGVSGWRRGVENNSKMSLPFLLNPGAREESEQPAPTSTPGGRRGRWHCGTPWHPAAAAPAAARAASTPRGGVHPAEKRGGSGVPGRRRTGEPPWTHGPRATRRLSRQEGAGSAGLRAPAVPGPRPALPFPFSGAEEGSGQGSPGESRPRGRPPPLCVRSRLGGGLGGAAARRRGPHPVRPGRAAGVGRAPPAAAAAAAAAVAPAAAAQRGTWCSPTPLQGSQRDLAPTSAFTRLAHALPASARLVWVGRRFLCYSYIPSPKFSPLPAPAPQPATPAGIARPGGGLSPCSLPTPPPTLCVQDPGVAGRVAVVDGNSQGHTSARSFL